MIYRFKNEVIYSMQASLIITVHVKMIYYKWGYTQCQPSGSPTVDIDK